MACFATPYGLRYAAHCFNRAYAQNNRPALIPAGGKLGVTSAPCRQYERGIFRRGEDESYGESDVSRTKFVRIALLPRPLSAQDPPVSIAPQFPAFEVVCYFPESRPPAFPDECHQTMSDYGVGSFRSAFRRPSGASCRRSEYQTPAATRPNSGRPGSP